MKEVKPCEELRQQKRIRRELLRQEAMDCNLLHCCIRECWALPIA